MEDRILILDDQEAVRRLLASELAGEGIQSLGEAWPRDLWRRLDHDPPKLLIMDPSGAKTALPDLLDEIRQRWPKLPVIVLSSRNEAKLAVDAIQHGAVDFLTKPLDMERLQAAVTQALTDSEGEEELAQKLRRFRTGDGLDFYKSASPAMSRVYNDALQVAMSRDTTALITGESGTGKEIIARLIHGLSPRHAQPFLELNCASIPSELLESELFGHEAGAFTDARESKPGLFELASGGSIFLDEIGEMSLNLQVKLLRFLERHSFRRVGGTKDIQVDVRIISATNQDLKLLIAAGQFREDLFYRLNVVPIKILPLRDRREDTIPLTKHFFRDFNPRFNKNFDRIEDQAQRLLLEYNWPGNIRELRNAVERIVLMESGPALTEEQLRPLLGGTWQEPQETFGRMLSRVLEGPLPDGGVSLEEIMAGVERILIEKAYKQAEGNQSRSAELLRLGRDKLRYRMKQHAMEKKPE